jgi:hypothetical protein
VIRVDAAILDPATSLPAWLRLVLVGVVTVVMWYLTRPFRKLTTMVTTGRMAFAMGDRSWYERGGGGGLFGRRRGLEAAVVDGDGDSAVIAAREESRGPAGLMRRAASTAAAAARPAQIRVPSTRLDARGAVGAGAAAAGAATAASGAAGGGSGGAPARASGGAAPGGPSGAGGAAGTPARAGGRHAAAAGAAVAAGRGGGGPGAGPGAAASAGGGAHSAAPEVPVHSPPTPPRRRPIPSPVRAANRRLDEGLFDAGAPGRVAPEDDGRGYLRPVRVEVADDDLYRLFDPAGSSRSGSRPGPAGP